MKAHPNLHPETLPVFGIWILIEQHQATVEQQFVHPILWSKPFSESTLKMYSK